MICTSNHHSMWLWLFHRKHREANSLVVTSKLSRHTWYTLPWTSGMIWSKHWVPASLFLTSRNQFPAEGTCWWYRWNCMVFSHNFKDKIQCSSTYNFYRSVNGATMMLSFDLFIEILRQNNIWTRRNIISIINQTNRVHVLLSSNGVNALQQ